MKNLKTNKMKQTAVEWLEKEIFRRYKFTFQQLNCGPLEEAIDQAKEMEKQQQDELAIGFSDWIRVCKLKQRPYDFDNIKELLEIYKDEKGL